MAEKPHRLVFLVMDGAAGPVEPLVLGHLRALREAAPEIHADLLLFGRQTGSAPPSRLFTPEGAPLLREAAAGTALARAYRSVPGGFFLALATLFRETFPLCFTRRLTIQGRAKDGAFMATVFKWLCLGAPRVIFDQRGDQIAEQELALETAGAARGSLRWRLSLAITRAMEAFALRGASRVLYVTERLREAVGRRYPFARRRPSAIFPCLAEAARFRFDPRERERTRRELGYGPGDQVLLYCGHAQAYQCIEETCELIRLCARERPSIRALFLTPPAGWPKIRARLEEPLGPGRLSLLTCPNSEVWRYLNAADAGFLLRRPSPVNEAASPTKFAEYALCGLPVLLTDGIGDASAQARQHGLGKIIGSLENLEPEAAEILKSLDAMREEESRRRRAECARAFLSRESQQAQIARFYREALGLPSPPPPSAPPSR